MAVVCAEPVKIEGPLYPPRMPAAVQAHDLSHPRAQDAGMTAVHFTPWQASRPCWHCEQFAGMDYQGTVARCNLTNGPRVRSDPTTGCSSWVREPGTDDEPGPPVWSVGTRVAVSHP